MGSIYFISDGVNIKIGYTKNNVEKRLKQLNTGNENNLYILGYINGTLDDEKHLHWKFGNHRIRQNGEWFYPSQEIIDYINNHNLMPHTYVEKDSITTQIMVYKTT